MIKRLLGILLGAFLAALDTDLFQIDQNIFYRFLPFKPSLIVDFSKYGLEGLIFLLSLIYGRVFFKNRYAFCLLLFTGFAYLTAIFNIHRENGAVSAMLGSELRQLWTCVLATGLFLRLADSRELEAGVLAFATVNAGKCVVLILNYFFGAKIAVLGIRTMVWDFTFLFTQISVVLVSCSVLLANRINTKAWLINAALCLLSAIVILGSFRRLAAVFTLVGIALVFLIHGRQTGKVLRYFALGLGVLSLVSVVGASLYVGMFGVGNTLGRVQSLVNWQEKGDYSTSNTMYADDWQVAGKLIRTHPALGIAFGKDYPIERVTEELRGETDQYIPLHVGLADYWVRMGMPFAILHILMLWIVLRAAAIRPSRLSSPLCAGALAMSFVFLLLPFAPAFLLDIKLSIVFAFCFAYAFRSPMSGRQEYSEYAYAA